MQFKITHVTEYEYAQPVSLCHNVARLFIRNTSDQECNASDIIISPEPEIKNIYTDFYGNKTLYFAIQHEHRHLKVIVVSKINKNVSRNSFDLYPNITCEEVRQQLIKPGAGNMEGKQFVAETDMTRSSEDIRSYALQSLSPDRPVFEAAKHLMNRIYTDFQFKPGFTTIATPLEIVLKEKKGVCQDFAHFAIACFRSVGLAARYVSGYIETLPPAGKEKLAGVDASHAWFAVFLPGYGWIDFDPTNNIIPAEQHITIGWGRDYADITPLKGIILSSGNHTLKVSVDVKRLA